MYLCVYVCICMYQLSFLFADTVKTVTKLASVMPIAANAITSQDNANASLVSEVPLATKRAVSGIAVKAASFAAIASVDIATQPIARAPVSPDILVSTAILPVLRDVSDRVVRSYAHVNMLSIAIKSTGAVPVRSDGKDRPVILGALGEHLETSALLGASV